MIDLRGGEPYPITQSENKKEIAVFRWSPNGLSIAFTSPDEKSTEEKSLDEETGDVQVYGQRWEFHRLRSVHVSTRSVETLYKNDVHVTDFAWNKDGTEIAFISQLTPEINSDGYHGATFGRLNAAHKTCLSTQRFPGPARDIILSPNVDEIYFVAGTTPNKSATSDSAYVMNLADGSLKRKLFGVSNCLAELRKNKDGMMAHVQQGLYDMILDLGQSFHRNEELEILTTLEPPLSIVGRIDTWDAISTQRGLVIVFVKSDCSSPSEVYCQEKGIVTQLSTHSLDMAKLKIGRGKEVYCRSPDSTECDGIFIRPLHLTDESKPLPTIVFIRGGPYGRITVAFNLLYYYWVPFLVSAGYAVFCPNYRGGSSHGEPYAAQARGAMGTTDYDDVISLVKYCISSGLIDETRMAIGGWSQGGFLSYLATTRQDLHFKAAVCGAGVTDWDMMCMSSDAPYFEAELTGKAPWGTSALDTKARHGSPIWHMEKVRTPILIVHGEKDERVPISQAIAFHRGCLQHGVSCEFVTYPREGHTFKERKHLIDMLKRIRRFCDLHLQ